VSDVYREEKMRITDAYQHFWSKESMLQHELSPKMGVLFNDYLPENLKSLLDEVGVQETVPVQTAPHSIANTYEFLDFATANNWLLMASSKDAKKRIDSKSGKTG